MSCPKLVCLKNFPIVRSMNSQNLDVYTFMERACIHDFYTQYARCHSHIGSSLNQNFMFKVFIPECNFFYMRRANN